MNLFLSAPSKSFLLGEYAILDGGPGLLVSTGPRFQMKIESQGEGRAGGIHPHSPAGQWIREHLSDFQKVNIDFQDPHEGRGGFGASSSQFLFANIWSRLQNRSLQNLLGELSLEEVWKEFRSLYADQSPLSQPSGGDLVSQWMGGLCSFSWKPFQVEPLKWNFKDLGFLLVRTGHKVNTHSHLSQIQRLDFKELKAKTQQGLQALKSADSEAFVRAVQDFATELEKQALVAPKTREILLQMKDHSAIQAAKGCGALGADVMALFFQPRRRLEVLSYLESKGLELVGSDVTLSEGLQVSLEVSGPSKSRTLEGEFLP